MEEPRQSKVSTRALKPGLCNKCKIKSIVESYHRELHIVKLEDVFDEHNATILNRDVATMETGQSDSSTAIAIRVIANTSKGRGLSLPADIGDSDWHRDVHLLRPMRDILSKEIGIFNHLCKLETVAHTSFATLLPTKTSIDRLSQDFIVGLEQDFPATVSTICEDCL
ncbi:hypothetical protein BASA83_003167 [Batrachochytrium salamandrivorans]|nr:hypothetical protein BASA83_003167 [Batrachochytrium salamandrivorans]